MASPAIDYDALAKQYGAISSTPAAAPAATTAPVAIDYDALAKQHGATSSTGGTPQVESSIRYLTTEDYKQPPPEPGAVARFGKQYTQQTGINDLLDIIRASNRYGTPQEVAARGEKAQTALGHVVTGLRDEPARIGSELAGIWQSMLDPKQDTADMSMHMLGAVPMVGPAIQGFVHEVWAKKYPEAAADLAAIATITKGPKVAEAAGDVALRGAQTAGRGIATAGTAVRGAATGMAQALPAATEAAVEKSIYGALGGPAGMVAAAKIAAAKELGKGAITGARSALAERLAQAAAERTAIAPAAAPVVQTPPLQLGPGPVIPPAPPDASFVRSVPAQYAQPEPIPLSRQLGPGPIITPPPPDPSFVRAVPAEYPYVEHPLVRAAQQAGGLTPEEQALADHILQNVEPTKPPATPPVAPAAPRAASAAPEAPAATQEPPTAPVVPEAPQTLQPAAAVEKLTDYVFGKKIAPHMVDRLPPEYWQMIADDAGTAVPTADEIAQIKANVAAKAVPTMPVEGEQVFETQKARIEEGMTPPKETPQEPPNYPPHYEYIRQADSKMAAERAFLKDQRVADYLLSRKPPITPEEFEGMTLEEQNKLILEAPAKSAKGKHLPFLPKPEGAKVQAVGRWAEEGIKDIADTMRWRQAQTPAVPEPAAIPTEGLENTPIAGKAGFEAEKAKPAPAKRTRRAKPRGEL